MKRLRPDVQLSRYREFHGFIKGIKKDTAEQLEQLEVKRFAGSISKEDYDRMKFIIVMTSYESIMAFMAAMEGSKENASS